MLCLDAKTNKVVRKVGVKLATKSSTLLAEEKRELEQRKKALEATIKKDALAPSSKAAGKRKEAAAPEGGRRTRAKGR